MKKMQRQELEKKLAKNEITLVEVLKKEDYQKRHIRKAVNLPLEEIGEATRERFLRDEPLVVYCTDENCTASVRAAEKLLDLGFRNVYHYPGGKKEWQQAGLPMDGTEISEQQKP